MRWNNPTAILEETNTSPIFVISGDRTLTDFLLECPENDFLIPAIRISISMNPLDTLQFLVDDIRKSTEQIICP